MAARSDPTWLRRRIGGELRALRESAQQRQGRKITTHEAAVELGCAQPKITSIEQGKHRLQWRDVRDLLKFYEASTADSERLVAWAKRSTEPIWWQPFAEVVEDWFAELVGGEGEAKREITYEHGLVPGLLQTERYASVLTERSPVVRPEHRQLVTSLRMERQDRLIDEDDPLELIAIIEESVLYRTVGGPEIMREQLEHLLGVNRRPNVTVRVIPTSVGPHAAIDGSFIMLEFAELSPAVYLQHHPVIGARYSDNAELMKTYAKIAKDIQQQALSPKDSAALIRETADKLP